MLIEFDMLFAVFALMLVLPVTVFQILDNQNAFTDSSKLFSDRLMSNSDVQKLAFQLGEIDTLTPNLAYFANNHSLDYSFVPYNQTSAEDVQNGTLSRLVVAGGKIYYLSVKR